MREASPRVAEKSGRRSADFLLFIVTSAELGILFVLTPAFTITDWIYVLQHVIVLGIALTRHPPMLQDHSLRSSAAVFVAYTYPYAQVIYLSWVPGFDVSAALGLVLVTLAAGSALSAFWLWANCLGSVPLCAVS